MKRKKFRKGTLFSLISTVIIFGILVALGVDAFVSLMVGNYQVTKISGSLFIVISLLYLIGSFTLIMMAITISNMDGDE